MIAELQQKVRTGQEEMQTLRTEVDSKLSEYESISVLCCVCLICSSLLRANKTFHQLRKEHASENAILKANHKKLTMQKDGLEKALQQKVSLK